jgi:ppGpp synthetase/RelA/SpoT-type nucleotidyltranferase
MEAINLALIERLEETRYKIIEGPKARSWDDETRSYFESIGMESTTSETLYTSIHYVIETFSRTKYTCEIQVRTLAEELWGETDHTINYPHATDSVPCKEQILVLAKVVGACSRLVDSIFRSHHEHEESKKKKKRSTKRSSVSSEPTPNSLQDGGAG